MRPRLHEQTAFCVNGFMYHRLHICKLFTLTPKRASRAHLTALHVPRDQLHMVRRSADGGRRLVPPGLTGVHQVRARPSR